MLYIEKGGEDQLKDELAAYNPLVPNGTELTATLMFEIDNPVSRAAFLGRVGGIEEKVFTESSKVKKLKQSPRKMLTEPQLRGKHHQYSLFILSSRMNRL